MRAYERLLKYVKVWTTSDEESTTVPSTQRQFDLARLLEQEMKDMGLSDVHVTDKCYVYGTIPATPGYEDKTSLGFIAHLDTATDFNGQNVNPQIIENYDGGVVELGQSGLKLDPQQFPELPGLKGRTLITTDGTTLLGADDKAGIAEILTAAEELLKGEKPHGKVCICFSPDEEIGGGAADLDIPAFGAEFGYTVDGGEETGIEYENFNAASASFDVHGFNIHPGDAKNKMINAALVAMEINASLPAYETPSHTEQYEGFYHLCDMNGSVEKAHLDYIVRDHSAEHFQARLEMLEHVAKLLNEKYGEGTVELTIKQQYRNMEEKVRPCIHLIDNAKAVIRELGREPQVLPIRGGTDGAQLSFRGLPCPNLGTGGYAYHGPYEHITAEGMDFATNVILGLVGKYAE